MASNNATVAHIQMTECENLPNRTAKRPITDNFLTLILEDSNYILTHAGKE